MIFYKYLWLFGEKFMKRYVTFCKKFLFYNYRLSSLLSLLILTKLDGFAVLYQQYLKIGVMKLMQEDFHTDWRHLLALGLTPLQVVSLL